MQSSARMRQHCIVDRPEAGLPTFRSIVTSMSLIASRLMRYIFQRFITVTYCADRECIRRGRLCGVLNRLTTLEGLPPLLWCKNAAPRRKYLGHLNLRMAVLLSFEFDLSPSRPLTKPHGGPSGVRTRAWTAVCETAALPTELKAHDSPPCDRICGRRTREPHFQASRPRL